ncbi:helix-turn-helix domain-containing protein [Halopenitus persicus]|uniref:HTH DNA binding domain-containing protein n=1 Tax=Halopenitus persicus TaxID=1048396 RepID=A0A1H3JP36_9EURY|nr:helix-turn-helix domain-containing protein [Halopenitus persicus]SDY41647.1 HTH DNA binding domain-containing protein [Halopenitus persicus]
MRYARVRIRHDPGTRHPMHAFEMAHDRIERAELRYWNAVLDGTNAFVFRVVGDPEPFRAKLEARESTIDYALTPATNGVFHCCVRDEATPADESYIAAFARGTLVVVPPIRFNPDGTTDLTLVGTAADVAAAVEDLPEGLSATVRSVGPYERYADPATAGLMEPDAAVSAEQAAALTKRQRAAVAAAVEHGYYDSPRAGAVSDVADELGVSTGTAAEHLRKAEATVMGRLVNR